MDCDINKIRCIVRSKSVDASPMVRRHGPVARALWNVSLCVYLGLALLFGLRAFGQTTNGLITGVISDSSGAVVAGAQVEAMDQATGALRTAKSDSQGHYIIMQLPPGTYRISVKQPGFSTELRPDVQLKVNQSATLDFMLTVSSAKQVITVTGAAPLLNTTSATLSNVVDHDATVALPLNGREFTQLTLLSPGAVPVENGQQSTFTVALGAGGISPSMNGQQGYQNNYTMDGVLNNATYTDIWAISPPPMPSRSSMFKLILLMLSSQSVLVRI